MKFVYALALTAMLAGGVAGCGGGGDSGVAAPASDARNGSYTVFEPNGTQQVLVLDFNAMTYSMTDPAGSVHSGAFSADAAEAGTYVFASTRITGAVNPARFRVTTDAVVGGFPFAAAASPGTYSVQPFVAARAWTATAAELDGSYNRFSVYPTSPIGPDSTIGTLKIANGGTTMVVCTDNTIFAIDLCPSTSLITYTVAKGPAPGQWLGTNVANPDPEQGATFYMARIGGQNVYLRASYSGTTATRFLRIALPDTAAWASVTAPSISTTSTWGKTTVTDSTYSRTRTNPDGTASTVNYQTTPNVGAKGPLGIRGVNTVGPDFYFAMQSSKLLAVVGARSNPNTVGNLSLALID